MTNTRRPRIVLVGDSTVTDRNGWGYGFKLHCDEALEIINLAAGGRSSKSYLDEGRWQEALSRRGDFYLIQFGHNDEPGKGPERETDPDTTYRANMARYVDDARAIGATPILVTSLARRTFEGKRLRSTLAPYVDAVKRLAAEKRVPLIDLHASSTALIEKMGEAAWLELSLRDAKGEVDRTHLGMRASLLIAPLVVQPLRVLVPSLGPHLQDTPLPGTAALQRVADAVVAPDGSGHHRGIQEAINAVPQNTSADRPWLIFVKAGTYRELVYVQREKRFVLLVGEDPRTTTITYGLHANVIGSDGKPIGTFRTPTLYVDADDFTIENLTIENSAGPVGQALALRLDGDRAVIRNSRFLGWQDTILLNRGRHYFDGSFIAGHVDFIFGGATAYFESCHLHAWRNGYLTAASTPAEQPYGFVFRRARITGAPGVQTFLGRPWRDHAHVAFLDSEMSQVVRREGWHNWDRPEREKTTRYFESGTRGSDASGRVAWARRMSEADARALSPERVLTGADGWRVARFPAHPSGGSAVGGDLPRAPGGEGIASASVIPLWPEGVPGVRREGGPERLEDGRVFNVHVPTLTHYAPPAARRTGTAIIAAPGGGYERLSVEKEGSALARIWTELGMDVFVLKYRLAEFGHPAPLQDVLRAVRLLRSRAADLRIHPERIGVFGASAGGHVAATAATLFDAEEGRTGARLDAVSARPDFVGLLYPVITMQGSHAHAGSRRNLLGETPAAALLERMSLETQVTTQTPPVFIVHTAADASVPAENSLVFYAALRAAGVPAEMHLYEKGSHGFATAADLGTTSEWPRRFAEWLAARGLLTRVER